MARQGTDSRMYVAPAARASANAVSRWEPVKRGSRSDVRSGIVARVAITCCRVVLAAADEAAATIASAQRASAAHRRSPACAQARLNLAAERESLNRTVGDRNRAVGSHGEARSYSGRRAVT